MSDLDATVEEQHVDLGWRWPAQMASSAVQHAMAGEISRSAILPRTAIDHPGLLYAVVDAPNEDAPREAYADYLETLDFDVARPLAAFIRAQMRVASAFRASRSADVAPFRCWRRDGDYVSTERFRHGETIRPWLIAGLGSLLARGDVGWPQAYRGFVERVGVRATRFSAIADELYRIAPIRHLVIVGLPAAVDEIAACPHLARIRSISLPAFGPADVLTDDVIRRFLASPYLRQISHLRFVQQRHLTAETLDTIVAAPTLPRLSVVEMFHAIPRKDPAWRPGDIERMIGWDTPRQVMRDASPIEAVERARGYVPCLHPETHYRSYRPDLEAVTENPIAEDVSIRALRGTPISAVTPARMRPGDTCPETPRARKACAVRAESSPGESSPWALDGERE